MTRVFLIRHAEAEGNLYRRAHGHFDSMITANGHKQLRALAARFENEHIDAVFSSNMRRTRATASAIAVPRGLQVRLYPGLREIDMGAWEDLNWGFIEHNWPEKYRQFITDPHDFVADGGESVAALAARMHETMTRIITENPDRTIVVASHGMSIRAELCTLQGLDLHHMRDVGFCDNTAVSLFETDGETVNIIYTNDNSHLKELSTLEQQTWWRKGARDYQVWFRLENNESDRQFIQFCKRATLTSSLNSDADMSIVALLNNEPVGLLELDTKTTGGAVRVVEMYLLEPFRNNGIGIQMLGQTVRVCREMNLAKIIVYVPENNPNMFEFCVKNGFSALADKHKKHFVMEKNVFSEKNL